MGISDWFAERRARKTSDQVTYEINAFLVRPKGVEPSDLGMVAALAGDLQYRLLHEGDQVDLYNPEFALMRVPDLLEGMTALGLKLQKSGFEARVPGVLVWVHTLRACRYLEIRFAAKQMWELVERGFPWADDAAMQLRDVTGFQPIFTRPLRVPSGFVMN